MADDPTDAEVNVIVASLFADSELRRTQEYLSRGRTLETMPLDDLRKLWAEDYKSWLAEGDRSRQQPFDDADAELRLRKAPQPHDLVKAYWPLVKARAEKVAADQFEQLKQSLEPDIERLLEEKKN